MATKNEQKWQVNYEQLKNYILEHHQLPDKKKLIKSGKLDAERIALLEALSNMRLKKEEPR